MLILATMLVGRAEALAMSAFGFSIMDQGWRDLEIFSWPMTAFSAKPTRKILTETDRIMRTITLPSNPSTPHQSIRDRSGFQLTE